MRFFSLPYTLYIDRRPFFCDAAKISLHTTPPKNDDANVFKCFSKSKRNDLDYRNLSGIPLTLHLKLLVIIM